MKLPTTTIRRFACSLDEKAVHIDDLRLRCGAEQPFLREGQQRLKGVHAFIAFAEWDIVLFVPAERHYADISSISMEPGRGRHGQGGSADSGARRRATAAESLAGASLGDPIF